MKGYFFNFSGQVYEIMSDALMHPEGDIQVVAMLLIDNSLAVFDVDVIGKIDSTEEWARRGKS